jgi:hypothetical protein
MENVEENRIHFIIATIIQEAENAKDRQKIESLKEDARRCGLDYLEEEIERLWTITRTELEAEQRYWMYFFKPFICFP